MRLSELRSFAPTCFDYQPRLPVFPGDVHCTVLDVLGTVGGEEQDSCCSFRTNYLNRKHKKQDSGFAASHFITSHFSYNDHQWHREACKKCSGTSVHTHTKVISI